MKSQMNQKPLNSTERIAIADRFIRKYKLSDEDICQDIYLAAIENNELNAEALCDVFTTVLASRTQSYESRVEFPKGLLIGIVRDTAKTYDTLIGMNDYAVIMELLSASDK